MVRQNGEAKKNGPFNGHRLILTKELFGGSHELKESIFFEENFGPKSDVVCNFAPIRVFLVLAAGVKAKNGPKWAKNGLYRIFLHFFTLFFHTNFAFLKKVLKNK